MTKIDPEEFDLAGWVKGIKRPERSVTIYQRPDIIAELDDLERKIKIARITANDEEAPVGARRSLRSMEADYQRLAEEFANSALTLRLRFLSDDDKRAIAKKAKAGDVSDLGYRIWAATIVSPKMTTAQAKALLGGLDEKQFATVDARFKSLYEDEPSVSADFLPKSSGQGNGTE